MKKKTSVILTCILVAALSITSTAANLTTVTNEKEGSTITIKDLTPREEDDDKGEKKEFSVDSYYPVEIKTAEEDGTRLLIKTFIVPKTVSPEKLIEEELTRHNRNYAVSDILKRDLIPNIERRDYTQNVTVPVETDNKEKLSSNLVPSIEFSENGFNGTLYLDENSIKTSVTDKKNYSYTLRDTREFTSLDRNDPYNIPKTTIKNGLTLSLTDIDWTPMGSSCDDGSVPTMYRATAHYAGTAWGSKASAYSATAQYSGEISKVIADNVIYSIVYEEVHTPLFAWKADNTINLRPLGMAVLAVAFLCGAVICVYILVNRVKKGKNNNMEEDSIYSDTPMDLPDMLNDMNRETEDDDSER